MPSPPSSSPAIRRTPSRWLGRALAAGVAIAAGALLAVVVLDPDRGDTAAVDYGSDVDPSAVPDPYAAGEAMPHGYSQLLGRDLIRPVYQPRFVAADAVDWPDDADVIGVEIGGEAKAYPVSFLTFREMVNDELGDQPILVTW